MSIVNKKAKCKLVGVDGNAFSLMAHWKGCALASGFTQSEVDKVIDECMDKDYSNLVKTLQEHSK